MQKPDLDRMWETFIKIGLPNEVSFGRLIHIIRFKIYPMISDLSQKKITNWYCFLIHKSRRKDDPNLYFHIRFALKNDIKGKERVNDFLPEYCEKDMTERFMDVERNVENISGIKKSLLENEEIQEAWRIIGEQSEWVMSMLNIHKKDAEINKYPKQIGQFLHYYFNMLGLQIKCPYCGSGGLIFPPL